MNHLKKKTHDFVKNICTNSQEWWKDANSIIALGEVCCIKGAENQMEKACEWFAQPFWQR